MEHRQVLENDPADTRYTPADGETPVVEEIVEVEAVEPEPAEVKDDSEENETRGIPADVEKAVDAAEEVIDAAAADGGISTAEAEVIKDAVEEVAEVAKPSRKTRAKKEA